jgi:PKD repeat protein
MRALALVPLSLLVLLHPIPAGSQYLFLDTNGDGVHDSSDQLAASGPTHVDIWLVTDRNRDGTPVVCDDAADVAAGLTINSYTIVLHSAGGVVKWGPMENRLPFTGRPACFASYEDTTESSYYHNGWGYRDLFPPGKYRLATLTVEVTSGNPSLFIEPFLPRRSVLITQFGTQCMARDGDNTYKLGYDWFDADGIGPMQADAGGPYSVQAGRTLFVNGDGSRNPNGEAITFHWDFGDGATAEGPSAAHVYAEPGDYTLILSGRSASESDADTTTVHVVPARAPIASFFFSPSAGYVGSAINFTSTSYDPDDDPITFSWDFGDGGRDTGARAVHAYSQPGEFTVRLTVSDGLAADTATRQVRVSAVAHPPVAVAGGPYAGLVGRTVFFDGTRSSDADGDALQYSWTFGDQQSGSGVVAGHAYSAAGTYNVRLTVTDGGLASSALTSASINESLPARAFGDTPVVIGASAPWTVHVEAAGGSFRVEDVDPWPITLSAHGAGSVDEIGSVEAATVTEDSDGNHVPELTMTFSAEDLALLLGGVERPATVAVTVRGGFFGGGFFTASMQVVVQSPEAANDFLPLRISPNPFNPEAVVTFSTSKPGPVRAHLFDVHGRMVRSVLDERAMPAGRHAVALDARGDAGTVLASGVYFFRLDGPDGVTTKRVAVAK